MKEKQKSHKPLAKERAVSGNGNIYAVTILFFAGIAVHALFTVAQPGSGKYLLLNRDWGFNHLYYFPAWVRVLVYFIAVLICLPAVSKAINSFLEKQTWSRHPLFSRFSVLLFMCISLLFSGLFYCFKIKYDFLGDMNLRIPQTINKEFVFNDYGSMFSLHYLHLLLNKYLHFIPHQTFVFHSILSGTVFVFLLQLVASRLGKTSYEKIIIFLFGVSIGALQFFFGYVEIYSFPALFFLLYIYVSVLCIENKLNILFPFLLLLVAIWFHMLGVGLIPSFMVLLYRKHLQHISWFIKIKTKHFVWLVLCSLPLPYLLASGLHIEGYLLPLSKTDNQMPLLSFRHLWEFFNSQILASGASFMLLLYLTYRVVREKIILDTMSVFFSAASFFMLYLAFVLDNLRGSGDWDILAFPAIAYSFLTALLLIRLYASQSWKFKYIALVIVFFNLTNTISWIGINSGDKSIKKIKDMLENDPGTYYSRSLPNDLSLAFNFKGNGLIAEALEYYRRSYNKNYSDPRAHYNYASELLQNGRANEGVAILENLVNMAPFYPLSYGVLISIYEKNQQHEKTYAVISKLHQAFSKNPEAILQRISPGELLNYFTFLYNVALQNNNEGYARQVAQAIEYLKQKK